MTGSSTKSGITTGILLEYESYDDVILLGVKGSTSGTTDEEKEWFLCKPTGKTSQWWSHFNTFHPIKHPGMKDQAVCLLCF